METDNNQVGDYLDSKSYYINTSNMNTIIRDLSIIFHRAGLKKIKLEPPRDKAKIYKFIETEEEKLCLVLEQLIELIQAAEKSANSSRN